MKKKNRKINNSFDDEFKNLKDLVKIKKSELRRNWFVTKAMWILFSVTIALLNIAILVLAAIALEKVIVDYENSSQSMSFFTYVAPTASVAAIAILLFILSLSISIYQGVMRAKIYLMASHQIQREYLEFILKSSPIKTETALQERIEQIIKETLSVKRKVSFKRTLLYILTGGTNE